MSNFSLLCVDAAYFSVTIDTWHVMKAFQVEEEFGSSRGADGMIRSAPIAYKSIRLAAQVLLAISFVIMFAKMWLIVRKKEFDARSQASGQDSPSWASDRPCVISLRARRHDRTVVRTGGFEERLHGRNRLSLFPGRARYEVRCSCWGTLLWIST